MNVLNLVAGDASRLNTLISLAWMTGSAGHLSVRRNERKVCLRVIEGLHAAPVFFVMTALTGLSKPAFVGIVGFVATDA